MKAKWERLSFPLTNARLESLTYEQKGAMSKPMIWSWLTVIVDFIAALIAIHFGTADKDLEILLLRHQLYVLERRVGSGPRVSHWEKCLLNVVFNRFRKATVRSREELAAILMFKPHRLINWHRALVQYKWTFRDRRPVGRPPISDELRKLIIRFANENTDWGYDSIEGERLKLGYLVDQTTVNNVLKRAGIFPPHCGGRTRPGAPF